MQLQNKTLLQGELIERAAWILSIIGAGGSGKTNTAYWILDNWFPDVEIYIFRYSSPAIAALPEHIRCRAHSFSSMKEILDRPGIVLLDDTALFFLSRSTSSKDNKDLVSNLTIARHNDLRFISTAQNSILIDKGVYESLDQFALRCRMTRTQALTEREEYVQLQLQINDLLQEAGMELAPDQRKGLRYCPETDEIIHFPLWEHMNERISKPYKGYYVESGELDHIRS